MVLKSKSLSNTICCIAIALLCFSESSFAKNIYVSVSSANSIQDGTLTNPYHTIQQASDVAEFGDVVLIRGGIYREEVKMKTSGITFQPYNNEQVTITGTEILSSWTLLSGSVYKTTMNWNAPEANQIFVDQKMIYSARWPDQTSSNLITPTDGMAESVTSQGSYFIIKDFQFGEPDGRWVGADIWVNLSRGGSDGQGWTGKVVATSQADNTITVDFGEPPRMGEVPWSVGTGTEFYLYNPTQAGLAATGGVEALLNPGEWLKIGNDLYVRTPNNAAPQSTGSNVVEAKKRAYAFHSSEPTINRNSYTIRNLTLFACTIITDEAYKSRRNAVVGDAFNILIDGISAKYISHFEDQTGNWQSQWSGRTGIVLSGQNNILKNSTIQYSAGPAVCVIGAGSRVLNNTIVEANYSVSNSGAVNTEAICLDCAIGYNTIRDTPIMAINFKGLKNSSLSNKGVARIHHNKIFNFMMRSADSGAIDVVGHEGNGARVDHNIIYNTRNRDITAHNIFALYWDFSLGGQYIIDHNVAYNVDSPMIINSTPFLEIYNNTLISSSSVRNVPINGANDLVQYRDGENVTIRNNIMSNTPNIACCSGPNLSKAIRDSNIENAFGTVANGIFVSPAAGNFQLKSTALAAIDKGKEFPFFNEPKSGNARDLGAYEFGSVPWKTGKPAVFAPVITPYSGDFFEPVMVVIKPDTIGAGILTRYTTDGTEPTFVSPVYKAPFTINASSQVRARTFINSTISSEVASVSYNISIIPLDQLRNPETPVPVENGIVSEYYTWWGGRNFDKIPLDLSLLDNPPRIDTTDVFGLQLPHRDDYFLFQFKGYIEVPANGMYTFYTTSDDASKLFIGDVMVVENDKLQPPTEKSGTIGLKAGKHRITVQFMEAGGGEALQVAYKGPSIFRTFIPASVLYHVSNPTVAISPKGSKFPVSKEVVLTASPVGSTVHYTLDGSEPTLASPIYTVPLTITSSLTLKAFAIKGGTRGRTATASFQITGPDVIISPSGEPFYESILVTLSSNPSGASLYYTTDGSTPTASSTLYVSPITLTGTTVLKVMARKDGVNGEVKTATFSKLNGPIVTISPAGGSFFEDVVVTITSPTPGATIYYTTNGTVPTTSSTVYTGSITLNTTSNTEVKAIAVKNGEIGEIKSEKYIINIIVITSLDLEESGKKLFQIFPNPSRNGTFTVLFQFSSAEMPDLNRLILYDTRGSVIVDEDITKVNSFMEGKPYRISGLSPGAYMLVLQGKKNQFAKRLVISD
jgi:hypothetical protein